MESQEKGTFFDDMTFASGVTLCCLVVVIILLVFLNYFNILRLSQNFPILSFLPRQVTPQTNNNYSLQQKNNIPLNTSINICKEQHINYPLITDILTTKANSNVGVYQGIVKAVNASSQSVTVASTPSEHLFAFTPNAKSSIFDIHQTVMKSISTITPGTKAVITFPCLQQNNTFQLTQLQLVK